MWCDVISCCPVLLSTTKYYSVLQSTTPVLLQYYKVLTPELLQYLQSTTPVLLHFGSSALICKIQTSENFLSLFVTFLSQPCLVSSLPWFPTSWVAWVRCSSHRLRWRHSMVSVDAGLETQPEVELVEKAEDKKQGWTPKSSEPDSEMTGGGDHGQRRQGPRRRRLSPRQVLKDRVPLGWTPQCYGAQTFGPRRRPDPHLLWWFLGWSQLRYSGQLWSANVRSATFPRV